jgi:hypothetical protein
MERKLGEYLQHCNVVIKELFNAKTDSDLIFCIFNVSTGKLNQFIQ